MIQEIKSDTQYVSNKWVTINETPAAAAAAKLLQWCPTLCDPINGSPPGSPIPGILQARILECVAIWAYLKKKHKTCRHEKYIDSEVQGILI